MIASTGHLLLLASMLVALGQMLTPLFLPRSAHDRHLTPLVRGFAVFQCLLLTASFFLLTSAFLDSDFSLAVVAANSHTQKPLFYKFSATWGNHEGSMLLWVWILSLYGFFLALSTKFPKSLLPATLAVQGFVGAGFLAFLIFTSHPFARLLPVPVDGQDLNPLLQDIGLTLHPPLLYLGYVGFSIIYSMALAALFTDRLDALWAKAARPYALVTWAFLTIGIGMGSWWAYRELGWGGWWFWDPVENAALLPWLSGTALLHSLIVLEKHGTLKRWTALLAILTFSLSLLGTFLVRSGIITSVHSFASDPTRGVFILLYMAAVCGGGLTVYGWRAARIENRQPLALYTRGGAILINNVFLLAACGTVALGTLYPMVLELVGGERVSVGAPFFNQTFLPLMVPLLLVAGIVPFLTWQAAATPSKRIEQAMFPATLALAAALGAWLWLPLHSFVAALGVGLAVWVIAATMVHFQRLLAASPETGWARYRTLSARSYAMTLGHLGFGVLALGIALSAGGTVEAQGPVSPGQTVALKDFTLQVEDFQNAAGENFRGLALPLNVTYDGWSEKLYPQTRYYPVRDTHTSEAAYSSTMFADLYAVISQPDKNGAVTARLYYLPGMNMIWIGIVLIAMGGFLPVIRAAMERKRNE